MKTRYTESEVRQLIIGRIKYGVTQKNIATELGVSESYLCDFLKGNRGLGEKMPKSMGFRIETVYIKAKND